MDTFKLQSDLKYYNMVKVYEEIRNNGLISRMQLSKKTGLSAMSMSRMISSLSEMGMVREVQDKNEKTSPGRPSVFVEVCADKAYCLSIDIEADCCKMVIADLQNRFIVYRELTIAQKVENFESVAKRIGVEFSEMIHMAGIQRESVLGCGMSLGAHVDYQDGIIIASSKFKWYLVKAADILEEILNIPVIIENDCKAALLGESLLLKLSGENVEDVVYLELGTDGVGSAAIIDGRLLRGSRNAAGEIGHITVLPEGDVCNCGRKGCFETVLTERFILRRAHNINPSYIDMGTVSEAINKNDTDIIQLFEEIGDYILIAINDISCAYNPQRIILNGPVVQKFSNCFEYVQQRMDSRLMKSVQPTLLVTGAKMGSNASLYGIGCAIIQKIVLQLLKGIVSKV